MTALVVELPDLSVDRLLYCSHRLRLAHAVINYAAMTPSDPSQSDSSSSAGLEAFTFGATPFRIVTLLSHGRRIRATWEHYGRTVDPNHSRTIAVSTFLGN